MDPRETRGPINICRSSIRRSTKPGVHPAPASMGMPPEPCYSQRTDAGAAVRMRAEVEAVGRPDPRIVHVWALKAILLPVIVWAVLLSVLGLYGLLVEPSVVAVAITWGPAVAIVAYAWAALYRRFYRWHVRDEEIQVWRGILFRRRTTIPYMRVQNVNVVRGPLLMLFGLSSIEIETAGQRGMYYGGVYRSEGYLPGLVDGEGTADVIIERVKGAKAREGL